MKHFKLFVGFCALAWGTAFAAPLTTGQKAFQGSVYRFVKFYCWACHETKQYPQFASKDFTEAYEMALNYVDFGNPEKSELAIRSANGHCGQIHVCRQPIGRMIYQIKKWKKGEFPN